MSSIKEKTSYCKRLPARNHVEIRDAIDEEQAVCHKRWDSRHCASYQMESGKYNSNGKRQEIGAHSKEMKTKHGVECRVNDIDYTLCLPKSEMQVNNRIVSCKDQDKSKCKYYHFQKNILPILHPLTPSCINKQPRTCLKSGLKRKCDSKENSRCKRNCKYSKIENVAKTEIETKQSKPEIFETSVSPRQTETIQTVPARNEDREKSLQMLLYKESNIRKYRESSDLSSLSFEVSHNTVHDSLMDKNGRKRFVKPVEMVTKCTKMMHSRNQKFLNSTSSICCLKMPRQSNMCKTFDSETSSTSSSNISGKIIALPWKPNSEDFHFSEDTEVENASSSKDSNNMNETSKIKENSEHAERKIMLSLNHSKGNDSKTKESTSPSSEQSNVELKILIGNTRAPEPENQSDDEMSYDKNRVKGWLQTNKEWIKQGRTGDRKYDGDRFDD